MSTELTDEAVSLMANYEGGKKVYKIMLSAGEASGDLQGEQIVKALAKLAPEAELFGLGGPKMQAAGMELVRDMRDYSVMGIWEVIKNLSSIFALLNDLTKTMEERRPDLLVIIDYPDFNWRLAKKARKLGIPVFSYIPPSAWAWRKGRAKSCSKLADELVALFPFELPPYQKAGGNIHFEGNPLLEAVRPSLTREEAAEYFHLAADERAILLLPGSRVQEITMLLPEMLKAAEKLQEKYPEMRFYLPVASGIKQEMLEQYVQQSKVAVRYVHERTYDLMALAEVAVATSGTVVLEAALLGLPCVILYKMSPLTYAVGKVMVHIDNFSLPNILAGKRIQPELLQDEVNTERIAAEVEKLYADEDCRQNTLRELKEACAKLGEPGAAERIAARMLKAAARGVRTGRKMGENN